jgi:hypothetical protein
MSLGWLSQSNFLPRRAKRIEGVTTNTMVNLKAALYDSQARKSKVAPPKVERSSLRGKNQGVEQRIQRDLNALRAEQRDIENSRAALERKTEIYNKMLKGEIEMNGDDVLIDFNTSDFQEQRALHEKIDREQQSSALLDDRQILTTEQDYDRLEWEKQAREEVQQEQRRHLLTENAEIIAKQTASARERVKKIRKQQKTKVQRRIAKIKKRAAENVTSSSITDRIMNLNDEYEYDDPQNIM